MPRSNSRYVGSEAGRKRAAVNKAQQGTSATAGGAPVVEHVTVTTWLDPYLSLKALSAYSGLSVRTLRSHLHDRVHQLPHFMPGGKVLVRKSEFDTWMLAFRRDAAVDADKVVREVLADLLRP